ncbi:MAG: putative transposase [Rubritalea sp.]|jgi:putative transposase
MVMSELTLFVSVRSVIIDSVAPFIDALGLTGTQWLAYKMTTKRKHTDEVAPNLLNQNFNPVGKGEVSAGDVI